MSHSCGTNVEFTVNSGQLFLWRRDGKFWYGVDGQNIFKCDDTGMVESRLPDRRDFFRNADKLQKVTESISKDDLVRQAVIKYPGLRLPRQDPFQCCISFIASSNASIQKIRSCLASLCRELGREVRFDGKQFFLFPKPGDISGAPMEKIRRCGLGYRSKYIRQAADMVENGSIDFGNIKKMDYFDAKEKLCSIPGVGNKVADCILLFSLDKHEAFPLDRWVLRILHRYYLDKFGKVTGSITDKKYDELHRRIVRYFGPYAGHAQQFLFKMERDGKGKGWL